MMTISTTHFPALCPFDSKPPFDEDGVSKEVIAALDPSLSLIDDEIGIKEDVEQGRSRQLLYMHGQKVFKFASKQWGGPLMRYANVVVFQFPRLNALCPIRQMSALLSLRLNAAVYLWIVFRFLLRTEVILHRHAYLWL